MTSIQGGRKRRRPSASLEQPARPRTRRQLAISTGVDSRLCAACRAIDFERVFTDVVGFGKWRSLGQQIQSCHGLSSAAKCKLCGFLQHLLSPDDDREWKLRAYSVRGAFRVPSSAVDDSVMLAFDHDDRKYGLEPHPLQSGRVVMECLESPTKIGGRRVGPHVDFALVASWLQFCVSHHTKLCQPNAASLASLPGFRVVDCQSRKVILWATLAPSTEFTALSYVWGSVKDDCALVNSCLPAKVPLLIDDAIHVTQKLGYQHLWIDRYCIPQDSDSDKHAQIQKMNLIYGSAAVTIIAAAGDDPTYGLPGVSLRSRRKQEEVQVGNRTLVSLNLDIPGQVMASKWFTRGWTFQEAYLSTRRLVFTDHMIYFHCRAMHCPEAVSAPLERLHTDNLQRFRDSVQIYRLWPLRGLGKFPADLEDRMVEYAKKQLSVASDALCAFEGILARFEAMERPVRTIWGVPIFDSEDITTSLLMGLSWQLERRRVSWLRLRRRPGFPSWSWTGWALNDSDCSFNLGFGLVNMRQRTLLVNLLSKFRSDKSTLRPAERVVEVDMQHRDGEIVPWSGNSDLVLGMGALGQTPPDLLRISGLTYEGRLRVFWVSRWGQYTTELSPQPDAAKSPLACLNDQVRWILGPIDIAARALSRGSEQRGDTDFAEQCFDIRIVPLCLLELESGLMPWPGATVMMVLRRSTGSSLWERLSVKCCPCNRKRYGKQCLCKETVRLLRELRAKVANRGSSAGMEANHEGITGNWKWSTSIVE